MSAKSKPSTASHTALSKISETSSRAAMARNLTGPVGASSGKPRQGVRHVLDGVLDDVRRVGDLLGHVPARAVGFLAVATAIATARGASRGATRGAARATRRAAGATRRAAGAAARGPASLRGARGPRR